MKIMRGVGALLALLVGRTLSAAESTGAVASISNPERTEPQELSTDRPDFTEATDTVPAGNVQIEGGFLASRHALASGSAHEYGLPFVLLRVGLTRFAELRWDAQSYEVASNLVNGRREEHVGGSDFDLAVKVRAWDEQRYLPAFAVIAGFSVPAGIDYFSSGEHDRILELCWSKSLAGGFDAGGNVNFQWGEPERAVSLSIGHKLGRGLRAYGEIYRISPIEGDENSHWIADAGVTKQIGSRFQIDAEVGHTLNARTPLWFLGAGFAVRFSGMGVVRAFNPRQVGRTLAKN